MTMKKLSALVLSVAVTCWGTPADAIAINWTAGNADWFTAGNWNPPQVPGAGDDATITNGGTANAGATFVVDNLNVGLRTSSALGLPHGFGNLNVSNGIAIATQDVRVGVTDTGILIGPFGGASGSVTTSGAGGTNGTLISFGNVSVGRFIFGPVGTATGDVDIQDGAMTGVGGTVIVGQTESVGSGDGTVPVAGSVLGFEDFFIGRVGSGASGDAAGVFTIQSGDVTSDGTSGPLVGFSAGSGNADGMMMVGGDALNMEGVTVGSAVSSGDATGNLTVDGMFENTGILNGLRVGKTTDAGIADGTMQVGTGIIDADDAEVGVAGAASTTAGSATGALTVLSGGIQGSNLASSEFNVGFTEGAAGAMGTANITGDVTGFDDINVGVVGSSAAGNATGDMDIVGGVLTGLGDGTIEVGSTDGSGTADGSLTVAGTVDAFEDFFIGRVSSGASGDATGVFTIQSGDVTSDGTSGPLVGFSAGSGNADGTMMVGGDALNMEGVTVGSAVSSGDATGNLTVDGMFENTGILNGLRVGKTTDAGIADGIMEVGGGITAADIIEVGQVGSGATGNATGALTARGGFSANTLTVGTSAGTGQAKGLVDLKSSLGTVSDTLTFGMGSILHLDIDGFDRGLLYGALDAEMAVLDGILNLFFGFVPVAGVFDLIVSGSATGITGDFDAVNFYGIAPGTLATYGVVMDMGVEIWRLEIGAGDPIPEPPPLAGVVAGAGRPGVPQPRPCRPRVRPAA